MDHRLATDYLTREIDEQIDYEGLKRNGYRDHGIVVKLDDQRLNNFERQFLKNIGGNFTDCATEKEKPGFSRAHH